jgi:hypothetical protein
MEPEVQALDDRIDDGAQRFAAELLADAVDEQDTEPVLLGSRCRLRVGRSHVLDSIRHSVMSRMGGPLLNLSC